MLEWIGTDCSVEYLNADEARHHSYSEVGPVLLITSDGNDNGVCVQAESRDALVAWLRRVITVAEGGESK